jgi:hypothetical protein
MLLLHALASGPGFLARCAAQGLAPALGEALRKGAFDDLRSVRSRAAGCCGQT